MATGPAGSQRTRNLTEVLDSWSPRPRHCIPCKTGCHQFSYVCMGRTEFVSARRLAAKACHRSCSAKKPATSGLVSMAATSLLAICVRWPV